MKSLPVCSIHDIAPNSGRAALVDGKQVALFRLITPTGEEFFALDNFCPFANAYVISRGIVGSLKGKLVVASPIYKQHFDLHTGFCIEDERVRLHCWKVNCQEDTLWLDGSERAAA